MNRNNEEIEIRELDDDDLDLPDAKEHYGEDFVGQDRPRFRADAMLEVDADGESISDTLDLGDADDDLEDSGLDFAGAFHDDLSDFSDDELFDGIDSSIDLANDDDLDF